MENKELINRILYLLLFIGLVIAIGKARIDCKSYTDEKITELANENNELRDTIDDLESDLEMNKRDTYDLWWATLDKNAFNKIENWEKENPNFMTCNKDVVDIDIRSSFFSKETSHAKSFVWELETGNVVYDRDGNVNCYEKIIMEEEPEPIDCIELCRTTKEAERDEML